MNYGAEQTWEGKVPFAFGDDNELPLEVNMVRKQVKSWALLIPVLFLTACSSSRELNESSAKRLIEDQLKNEPFKVRVGAISGMFGRTLRDYKSSPPANDEGAALARLLDKGFVEQKVEAISYPEVSGRFMSKINGQGEWVVYQLHMIPNSNIIVGGYGLTYSPESPSVPDVKLKWSVAPDGRIKLNGVAYTKGQGLLTDEARYVKEGSAAYLDLQQGVGNPYLTPLHIRCKGTPHGRVDLKWYTYSWSPAFQKELMADRQGPFVRGGILQVGHVSGLRLTTDNEAVAKFTCQASLNDLGKLFYPGQAPDREGQVSFGKKPDGTWFVDRLSLDN